MRRPFETDGREVEDALVDEAVRGMVEQFRIRHARYAHRRPTKQRTVYDMHITLEQAEAAVALARTDGPGGSELKIYLHGLSAEARGELWNFVVWLQAGKGIPTHQEFGKFFKHSNTYTRWGFVEMLSTIDPAKLEKAVELFKPLLE